MKINLIKKIPYFGIPQKQYAHHEKTHYPSLLWEDIRKVEEGTISTALEKMGYKRQYESHTSGPINAIFFNWKHGSLWGGASNYGEDYGIGW